MKAENANVDMNPPPAAKPAEVARYCPTCGSEMREARCKLRCEKCGFFLSCSDFY